MIYKKKIEVNSWLQLHKEMSEWIQMQRLPLAFKTQNERPLYF